MVVSVSFCIVNGLCYLAVSSAKESGLIFTQRTSGDSRHSWGVTLMCSSSTCDDNPKDGKENGTETSVDAAKGEGSSHYVRSEVLLKLPSREFRHASEATGMMLR